jgi:hypothetical protein
MIIYILVTDVISTMYILPRPFVNVINIMVIVMSQFTF